MSAPVLGLDPGINGAAAVVHAKGELLAAFDLPAFGNKASEAGRRLRPQARFRPMKAAH
jgi:hypothetical protein